MAPPRDANSAAPPAQPAGNARALPLSTELMLWLLAIMLSVLVGVGAILFGQTEEAVTRELQQEARVGAIALQRAVDADPHSTMVAVMARGLLESSPGMAGIRIMVGEREVFHEPPTMSDTSPGEDEVLVTLEDASGSRVSVAMHRSAGALTRQRWTLTLFVVMAAALGVCALAVAAILRWRLGRPLSRLRRQVIDGGPPPKGLPGELRLLSEHLGDNAAAHASESHRLGRTEEELQRASALQRLMLRELDHRVRNNLASIAALIDLERYAASDVATFADRLGARLGSMRQVQDLLSSSSEHATDLGALTQVLIPADVQTRVRASGPPIDIPGPQAVPLGMVIHELLTNAMRHGALSSNQGSVTIGWTKPKQDAAGRRRLQLSWTESDGPQPRRDIMPGCGTGIITGLVQSELAGTIDLRYPPSGAVHRIDIQLRSLAHSSEV
ncbi:MAG: sensor histidine kinase [Phycisphaerales bacterium]|nr:sensor histidine kinase [Phycisphaerales bacterium]